MDYTIQGNTRQCAATGRRLAEGEAYYSVLREQEGHRPALVLAEPVKHAHDFSALTHDGKFDIRVRLYAEELDRESARSFEMALHERN